MRYFHVALMYDCGKMADATFTSKEFPSKKDIKDVFIKYHGIKDISGIVIVNIIELKKDDYLKFIA